eukprot:TRINITY_DN3629_c2_g1_i1.p1 TRINITY_DN3629_c2_g1~~TRINITY_DN3629_c2_g1_i1.p1  ORF type:complete len:717 (+),score=220.73 TRINITY_DN3629_c2_g1_i1:138-2153(+)
MEADQLEQLLSAHRRDSASAARALWAMLERRQELALLEARAETRALQQSHSELEASLVRAREEELRLKSSAEKAEKDLEKLREEQKQHREGAAKDKDVERRREEQKELHRDKSAMERSMKRLREENAELRQDNAALRKIVAAAAGKAHIDMERAVREHICAEEANARDAAERQKSHQLSLRKEVAAADAKSSLLQEELTKTRRAQRRGVKQAESAALQAANAAEARAAAAEAAVGSRLELAGLAVREAQLRGRRKEEELLARGALAKWSATAAAKEKKMHAAAIADARAAATRSKQKLQCGLEASEAERVSQLAEAERAAEALARAGHQEEEAQARAALAVCSSRELARQGQGLRLELAAATARAASVDGSCASSGESQEVQQLHELLSSAVHECQDQRERAEGAQRSWAAAAERLRAELAAEKADGAQARAEAAALHGAAERLVRGARRAAELQLCEERAELARAGVQLQEYQSFHMLWERLMRAQAELAYDAYEAETNTELTRRLGSKDAEMRVELQRREQGTAELSAQNVSLRWELWALRQRCSMLEATAHGAPAPVSPPPQTSSPPSPPAPRPATPPPPRLVSRDPGGCVLSAAAETRLVELPGDAGLHRGVLQRRTRLHRPCPRGSSGAGTQLPAEPRADCPSEGGRGVQGASAQERTRKPPTRAE